MYVGQPLDTLKVKMQTFPQIYPRLSICFRQTLSQEGVVRGLYAGTVPSLAANVAENSILFAAYGACQKMVARAASVDTVDQLGVLHPSRLHRDGDGELGGEGLVPLLLVVVGVADYIPPVSVLED